MMHSFIGGVKILLNIRKEIYNAIVVRWSSPSIFSPTIAPYKRIIVPTQNIKLNKFGNLTRATRNKLFDDKNKFFEGIPKGLTGENNRGIWERYGRNKANPSVGQRLRMVANYVGQAQYRPKFPFKKIVQGGLWTEARYRQNF